MGHSYKKNGQRNYMLENNKSALKYLKNFSSTLSNMHALHSNLENYDGVITEDNLNTIANAINLENKFNLMPAQIDIVTKKLLEI